MAVAVLICILLAFAAWRDFATRTIQDAVSALILLAGLVARVPGGWSAVATSAATMTFVFAALLPFHSRGLVGGGDLKLLAALAFGLSPFASYQMIASVVLAGGVLALLYVALRRILIRLDTRPHAAPRDGSIVHRVLAIELWRIRKGAPLPYALAIAVGAALVIGHQGA
jgi:prepilin peptidase CpaA